MLGGYAGVSSPSGAVSGTTCLSHHHTRHEPSRRHRSVHVRARALPEGQLAVGVPHHVITDELIMRCTTVGRLHIA
jgi:hypothetical protein